MKRLVRGFTFAEWVIGITIIARLTIILFAASAHARENTPEGTRFAPASRPERQEKFFTVSGAVVKPESWTVARLSDKFASEIKTVDYVLKEDKRQARCVPLLTVLKASELRLNPRVKNHPLAFAVFVRAEDGYTACFSWGELQADVGKREVWIALDRAGHPIPQDDGPVELIVKDDAKPARWVHGISRIVLVDGIATTEQSEKK